MIDLDLFFDISRDVAMATDFVQKRGKITYPPALIVCHSETKWAIVLRMSALIAPLIALHRVKNGEKSNRKSYTLYQMAMFLMTLGDP